MHETVHARMKLHQVTAEAFKNSHREVTYLHGRIVKSTLLRMKRPVEMQDAGQQNGLNPQVACLEYEGRTLGASALSYGELGCWARHATFEAVHDNTSDRQNRMANSAIPSLHARSGLGGLLYYVGTAQGSCTW